jgi:hypothetical protein
VFEQIGKHESLFVIPIQDVFQRGAVFMFMLRSPAIEYPFHDRCKCKPVSVNWIGFGTNREMEQHINQWISDSI